ncbi:MAG: dGTP triphosphohydrolase [Verrucomicrobiota bacterium]
MHNRFYNDFDKEPLGRGYRRPEGGYRSTFQVDRDRILHTGAFRRLQSKTQVFLSGEYDVYRTRLTHSLEVAQIGRSICHWLQSESDFLTDDYFIDPDLVEAACLSHDLGHPPFGHNGERTLHRLMKDLGGFEGNAQTLRILTDIIYTNHGKRCQEGMNPSRAFLDSILKYKTCFHETPEAPNHFIYSHQEPCLHFVFGPHFRAVANLNPGAERNAFKSIECQIMDWADDTAYSLNDLVDGISVGFLTLEKIERWANQQDLDKTEGTHAEGLLRLVREQRVEPGVGGKIGRFIQACRLVPADVHPVAESSDRYRFDLVIDPDIKKEAEFYKRLALEVVFRSQQLQQLDHKGNRILESLFRVFMERYGATGGKGLRLLPETVEAFLERNPEPADRARIVCDHIASMTDGFSTRTYRRLFDSQFGSIVDLVQNS